MKFFEYMAKRIFNEEGIPILEGHVANSAEEATSIASDMGVPVAIKSQVLVGGRGKAGGIKFADNPGEAYKVADSLIGTTINGERVHQLLIEKKANIIKEFFSSRIKSKQRSHLFRPKYFCKQITTNNFW